jgi:predicted transcriptional regulator
MSDTSKVEMILSTRQPHVNGVGYVSSTERLDDDLAAQLADISKYSLRTPGELLGHAFWTWLKSAEAQRIMAIINGRKEIAAGDVYDFDDVLAELEAIIRGDDPGDG